MNKSGISLFVMFILLIISGIAGIILINKVSSLEDENYNLTLKIYDLNISFISAQRMVMYDLKYYNRSSYVNGVAFGENHFCIWTEGRSEDQISETILHEWLHIEVGMNRTVESHFY